MLYNKKKWKEVYLVSLVRVDNEGVQVSVHIILWSNLFLDQVIFALVAENDMDFLIARTTNVRAWRNEDKMIR